MGRHKKPFIDKRNAHRFHLVHRSQRDPLQADTEASERVLLPLENRYEEEKDQKREETSKEKKMRQKEYGIDFEDDYDYLQHLKPRAALSLEPIPDDTEIHVIEAKQNNKQEKIQFGNLVLPSEVFASKHEEKEGLLNLAVPVIGPQPDWDPDIVAALDDDLDLNDPNNLLDDDFIMKANEYRDIEENPSDDGLAESDESEEEGYYPSDEADNLFSDEENYFEKEETATRFTGYSMSSSVLHRNEGLTLLDDRFEKVMEEYDDDEIGALDHEEVMGRLDSSNHLIKTAAEEFLRNQEKNRFIDVSGGVMEGRGDHHNESDDELSPEELVKVVDEKKEKWDCESILSTYSNLYNHPKLIKEPSKIKLSYKTGIPLGVLPKKVVRNKIENEQRCNDDTVNATQRHSSRPHNESKDEKKLRKQIVKEERRIRRMEKKSNKTAFKTEQQRQEKAALQAYQQQGKKL